MKFKTDRIKKEQLALIFAFKKDEISLDELDAAFEEKYKIDLFSNTHYLDALIEEAIHEKNESKMDAFINILWLMRPKKIRVHLLNKLLICPYHKHHQAITKEIQDIAAPSSVPFIAQILKNGFKNFAYTLSEDSAIAKWFSWALFCIGNQEAVDLMIQYSNHPNKEIAQEMQYRLSKLYEKNK